MGSQTGELQGLQRAVVFQFCFCRSFIESCAKLCCVCPQLKSLVICSNWPLKFLRFVFFLLALSSFSASREQVEKQTIGSITLTLCLTLRCSAATPAHTWYSTNSNRRASVAARPVAGRREPALGPGNLDPCYLKSRFRRTWLLLRMS